MLADRVRYESFIKSVVFLPMAISATAAGVIWLFVYSPNANIGLLNAVLLAELISLALVAGVVGLVCGYFIAASLLPDAAASLRGLYGAQIPGQLTLKSEWWVAGLTISVAGASISPESSTSSRTYIAA